MLAMLQQDLAVNSSISRKEMQYTIAEKILGHTFCSTGEC